MSSITKLEKAVNASIAYRMAVDHRKRLAEQSLNAESTESAAHVALEQALRALGWGEAAVRRTFAELNDTEDHAVDRDDCPANGIPRPGDRMEDGGRMGTTIRCGTCDGDGVLHLPDVPPATASPIDYDVEVATTITLDVERTDELTMQEAVNMVSDLRSALGRSRWDAAVELVEAW